jgi:hypothetical protein
MKRTSSKKTEDSPQLDLPSAPARESSVPLSGDEAAVLAAITATPAGLTGKEAADVIGETPLLTGHILTRLRKLRLVTREGPRHLLRERAAIPRGARHARP